MRRQITFLRPPTAFTLVELLVVIAIIGVLVSLLLPAIQASREAARRTGCLNNITQLSIAAHNYDFHFEVLPPGVTNPDGPIRNEPQGQHVSWMVHLLPYCEQRPLFDKFDIAAGAYAPENVPVRSTTVEGFLCPSSRGTHYNYSADGMPYVAQGSYAACYNDSEEPIDVNNNGLMFLNSRIRFNDIYDGSTNTLLLSEVAEPRQMLGWVSGTRATLRNTSAIEQPGPEGAYYAADLQVDPLDPENSQQDSLHVGGFSSDHTGGVNAAFADGSSRFIADSIDPAILRLYGNRADGEIIRAIY